MLLEQTISQLDIGHVPSEQAEKLGHLGYMQWLHGLKGDRAYLTEAIRAYDMAQPFIKCSPALGVFCELLLRSTETPLVPLKLILPPRKRRGGAQARRDAL